MQSDSILFPDICLCRLSILTYFNPFIFFSFICSCFVSKRILPNPISIFFQLPLFLFPWFYSYLGTSMLLSIFLWTTFFLSTCSLVGSKFNSHKSDKMIRVQNRFSRKINYHCYLYMYIVIPYHRFLLDFICHSFRCLTK